MTRLCEAKTRSGGLCGRPAGWRTPHARSGRCKLHRGSTPDQIKHEAQGEALEADPLAGMMQAVRLACGVTAYHRQRVAIMQAPTRADEEALERAVFMQSRVAKAALDARIERRIVNLAERAADQIVLVIEEGPSALVAAGVTITNEQRTIHARAIRQNLARLEDEPDVIESTGRELAA
jgi:hypothetical protein